MRQPRIRDHAILIAGTLLMTAPLVIVFLGAGNRGGLNGDWRPTADYMDGIVGNTEALARLTGGETTLTGMVGVSLAIAVGVALITTLISMLAAFVLVFMENRLARWVFAATILTLYFPIEARMLPTFDTVLALGLINSLPGLILPILPIAVATFLFRQHFRGLPPEIMEAARLDGTGPVKYLFHFVVPLSWPPILAVFLVTFMVGWNQYLWPLMISTDNSLFPIMRGLNLAGTGSGPSLILGAVSLLPPLVLVLLFTRALSRVAGLRV
ncbi:ABC transporter permease subunit [Alphaproteobacteria bacterium GH1-50]|uniref:sn-glycerol-3-phosphate transport system permease protein UgpE n=1 Tax=Kangsaoukella pontilimi TaxID=2691042 RepID=A0A7C9NC67_9RHOB|nr:carbohydrate ABC transporter permease [Kangsaoukella pontilimi]MXQ06459.1 ABC transporter permease subunit [Kangsaoukella pontilimi]